MADWLDSVELTKGRGVWVRRDLLVEELPSLDLDDPTPLHLPIEDRTTDRTLAAHNRASITRPPVQDRAQRPPATPRPLYGGDLLDEGPDPGERTPPTFDMGLVPASYMEDEPTEAGADPQAAVEQFRGSIDFADYDDAEDLSTDCVSHAELTRAIEAARRNHAAPAPQPLVPHALASGSFDEVIEAASAIDEDDVSLSLTLDLDPSWLVPQVEQQPASSRTPEPAVARSLAERAPAPQAPAARLADRAPAPQVRQPVRDTIPTYLRTEPQPAAIPGWVVNATTFLCGIVVGGTCAGSISALSFAAVLLA